MKNEIKQQARRRALQYMFQLESERMNYFSQDGLQEFLNYNGVDEEEGGYVIRLIKSTLEDQKNIDEKITQHLKNWTLQRLSRTDRSVLRLAKAEFDLDETPRKVVINEAVDIAREFGNEDSPKFVNGILDKLL